MLKSATTLLAALTAGWVLFGSPTSASAGEDCGACKPTIRIIHKHRVVEKNVYIHHHKDVDEKVPVRHTTLIVTDVTPIKHVHEIVHVTIHKVPVPYYVTDTKTVWNREKVTFDTRTVTRYVGCGCQSHHAY